MQATGLTTPHHETDFVAAGAGPLVVLVHSSMSGARQWTRLMSDLGDRFAVRAVNLFGYGRTPAWRGDAPPTLDDYAEAVTAVVPATERVSLVGHSFGGAVAMEAARRLTGRVDKLVLIEPSLFYLLGLHGANEAYAEISGLSERMDPIAPAAAAEHFIDYWAGSGAWAATPDERKAAFVDAVATVTHEWNAVFQGATTREDWAAILPRHTMLLCSHAPRRPSREIMELLADAQPGWAFARVAEGGHMAPLTHPHLINPVTRAFLDGSHSPH